MRIHHHVSFHKLFRRALFSGAQHLHQRAHIPDYLLEELTALTEVLEKEILE